MYTKAELFLLASEQAMEPFCSNVILSIREEAKGCVDLDAEKIRLSKIWEVANADFTDFVKKTGLNQTTLAKRSCIPLRTVQHWCGGDRDCPVYVRFLLAERYRLI